MATTDYHHREVESLLFDIARKIQLSPTRYDEASRAYTALCQYIDRPESPLAGLVVRCYPSGSFSTGTVISSIQRNESHDVDAVIELHNSFATVDPATVLAKLFLAINGSEGSRYYGKARKNSRCVTVEYESGLTVDLMPIVVTDHAVQRAGVLFHHKEKEGEKYTKPVNPWGFKEYFNAHTATDANFARSFWDREYLVDGAQTTPMPEVVPPSLKSSRVVALQLIKRFRDVQYTTRTVRQPPAVVLAALSLESGAAERSLALEVLKIGDHLRNTLLQPGILRVTNPSYPADEFTDRWPRTREAQMEFARDIVFLQKSIRSLLNEEMNTEEIKQKLSLLFGEKPAAEAIIRLNEARSRDMSSRTLKYGAAGRVVTAAGLASVSSPARSSTFTGGDKLD